jgi:hypothetical protein
VLWSLVSSAFVIYLYRTLNTAAGRMSVPVDAIDAELAKLTSRIDAIEKVTGNKSRTTTP